MKPLQLLLIALVLTSCKKATEKYIAGYWEMDRGFVNQIPVQGEFRIQFFKDNTGRWGSSYFDMDSITWSFDKKAQKISIEEMHSDSTLDLFVIEKFRDRMRCKSSLEDTNFVELYLNRL